MKMTPRLCVPYMQGRFKVKESTRKTFRSGRPSSAAQCNGKSLKCFMLRDVMGRHGVIVKIAFEKEYSGCRVESSL